MAMGDESDRDGRHSLRSAALARAEAAESELQELVYAVSHDLREPVRMIASYLQLVDRCCRGQDSDTDEFLDFAIDGGRRLGEMIDGLLDYSRVVTRGEPFREVDLGDACRQAIADLSGEADTVDAGIDVASMPVAWGDAAQVQDVFRHLLDNSLKFRDSKPPRITVRGEVNHGGRVEVEVADTGIGIDPRFAGDIFVIFRRLHPIGAYSGAGAGLAICRRIVERHGGRIWVVRPEAPGVRVRFTLPLPECRARSTRAAAEAGKDG